jgi:hypothetical protein
MIENGPNAPTAAITRFGQRNVELVPIHVGDAAIGSLRECMEAIGQKLIEPGLAAAFHVES